MAVTILAGLPATAHTVDRFHSGARRPALIP
jgi:hypothetical protein